MAIVRDLVIEQGETQVIDVQWRSKSTNVPVDITDCELILQVRKEASPASPVLLELSTTSDGIEITDAVEGKFRVTISDEASYALSGLVPEPAAKRAVYEMMCRFPGGETRKLWKGQVLFYKAVVYPPAGP